MFCINETGMVFMNLGIRTSTNNLQWPVLYSLACFLIYYICMQSIPTSFLNFKFFIILYNSNKLSGQLGKQ